ncbi:UTRA domain-containing protein [Embleya scabrispora]|uniref:UTRA domain-containing protein n=1 Tax=Embleya scabrispora TaxID=159449 RepID=UPI000377DCE6|nr:UTRA domain-containing protein [Embleya scabrispora]MYS85283.1 UTRA domain-containing protein [Streptomyces sp. SID5474]
MRTLTEPAAPWPHGTGERHLSRTEAPSAVADMLGLRIGARVHCERVELLDPDGRTSHLLVRYTSRLRPVPGAHALSDLSGRAAVAGEAGMLGVATGPMLLVVPVVRYSRDGRPAAVDELLLPADRWRVRLT